MPDSTPVSPDTEQNEPRRSVWRRWRWVWFGCFVVLGWLGFELATLPFAEINELRNSRPGETAFMREQAEQARENGKRFRKLQEWVSLGGIPQDLINAVIVAEDGRFWRHSGFDWFEFRESVERNLKEGRAARGASTITQQLVKNLFLSSSKNPVRKLREWVLTWWMERTLSKRRILELYLNVIEWGPGIYGVQAASEFYFHKNVSELTREEAVRLAAVIPNPRRHTPDEQSEYLERRIVMILERMEARGY